MTRNLDIVMKIVQCLGNTIISTTVLFPFGAGQYREDGVVLCKDHPADPVDWWLYEGR
jgi:hypothetical protein